MGWNGADFIDELSAKLGDTTTSFETKVLGWLNDGVKDIASRHVWAFLRVKGQKVLTASTAEQDLSLGTPSAPTLAALAGGSLAADSAVRVLITFYESTTKHESVAGTPSASITPTGSNLSITVTDIPVSGDPLVTERRVYTSLAGAAFKYYSTISNNTATTTTITAPTTSDETPPDEHSIRLLDGDPFIEGTRVLVYKPRQQLIQETGGNTATNGTPDYWADVQEERVFLYPRPSTALTLSFYYSRIPRKTYNSISSPIDLPEWLKPDLENYVVWRGYSYRDRDGQESKLANYKQGLAETISQKGAQKKVPRRVRNVTANSNGNVF
jgi:hypothetical protein